MKGILINPESRTITEVEVKKGINAIYALIHADTFDCVYIDPHNTVYVDDNGLLNDPEFFFKLQGYPQPLAGRGLILGVDDEGGSRSATVTLDWAQHNVTFERLQVEGFRQIDTVVDHPILGPNTPLIGSEPIFRKGEKTMKRLAALAAALLMTTSIANATLYECKFGAQKFAKRTEQRQEARDPDPVTSIFVRVWSTEEDNLDHMQIVHATQSGRFIDRTKQYTINATLVARDGVWTWHAQYARDPSVSMTGKLTEGPYGVFYSETRFKYRRAEWSNTTICRPVPEEEE